MPRTDTPAEAGTAALTAAHAHIPAAQSADPSYAGHHMGQYIEVVGPLDTSALDGAVRHTLDEAPWFRSRLMARVGRERHLLVQHFHLLAVDGYGVALLSRRIAEVYTALVRGRPPGPTPFAPASVLADADHAYTGSAAQAADRRYWTGRYADRPAPVSPAGRAAPAQDTALRHSAPLDAQDSAAVRAAARSARVTWAEVVLATTAVRVTAAAGSREAVLAVYATARTGPGTLRVPATAVNVLPVRLPVRGADTFRSLLGAAGGELTLLRRHQRFRGEELARELWPECGGGRVPGPLVNLRPFETELDFGGIRGRVVQPRLGAGRRPVGVRRGGPRRPVAPGLRRESGALHRGGTGPVRPPVTGGLAALCGAPDAPVASLTHHWSHPPTDRCGHPPRRDTMATNPFEDDDARYFVLVNAENQHSLWPAFAEIPGGWTVVHGEDSREGCAAYTEAHWTDMRPASLVARS